MAPVAGRPRPEARRRAVAGTVPTAPYISVKAGGLHWKVMSTLTELAIPADEFALGHTLAALPEMAFKVERVVAHDSDHVMPFVWTAGSPDDFDRLDDALDEDDSVDEFTALTRLDGERLYQMDWVTDIRIVVRLLLEERATILKAHGRGEQWSVRILFPTRDSLSATLDFCERYELSADVQSVYELRESPGGRYGLTEQQYEALVAASEQGYYRVPREVTLRELADEFDVSHQSLSELLRRGQDTLVRDTLFVDDGDELALGRGGNQ